MKLDLWREHQGYTIADLARFFETGREATRLWCRKSRGEPGRTPELETQFKIERMTRGVVSRKDW